MADFQTSTDGLWASQPIDADEDYTFDYTSDLAPGETVVSSFWSADTGITLARQANTTTGATAGVTATAGTASGWFLVSNLVVTSAANTLSRSFRLFLEAPKLLGQGITSAFPSLVAAIASLRRDRLIAAARTYLPGVTLEDDYLLEKLVAAEASVQRQLRVFLSPREMLPFGADPSEATILQAAGNAVEYEPGYDYDPQMFIGNRWGLIELRQKPLIEVHSITFDYPAPNNTLFTIPNDWIRPDNKYGRVNLLPIDTAIALPLNAFILSALGGGRTVPLMLQVRYRAGIANCAVDFPDILDVVKKEAVLSVIEDAFAPPSSSTSVDGLSDSISADMDRYRKLIDQRIERLRQSLHGPRMMVM